MADNRKSYRAVLRGLKAAGLNHKQAQVAWRGLKDRLGATPRAADLKRHPRITREEVKRAPARERAQRAARTRAEKAATAPIAPAKKAPSPKPKAPPAKPPEMAIKPERMRELQEEWNDFDREVWDDQGMWESPQ